MTGWLGAVPPQHEGQRASIRANLFVGENKDCRAALSASSCQA